ncbi:MAG: hypothetical protein JEY99_02215 [Spirochaetales bacterium]|nr:hypothetical protein [Spirochaetales bacterium]
MGNSLAIYKWYGKKPYLSILIFIVLGYDAQHMDDISFKLPSRKEITTLTGEQGFSHIGFLDLAQFTEWYIKSLSTDQTSTHAVPELLTDAINSGLKGILITALPIMESPSSEHEQPQEPSGEVAPFASDNYYKKAVGKHKIINTELRKRTGYSKRMFRIFCNSRFPEKAFAAAAGIGFIGKNSLLISRDLGSGIVLSGMLLPWFPENSKDIKNALPLPPGEECGKCMICIKSCPTRAIIKPGVVDRGKCLQSMSTGEMRAEFFPLWGTRIYGCQECQDRCPYNHKTKEPGTSGRSNPGPEIPLERILTAGTTRNDIKSLFKGTTLDQGWIKEQYILRNALIATGNHPDGKKLESYIKKHELSEDKMIKEAALWADVRLFPEKEKNT